MEAGVGVRCGTTAEAGQPHCNQPMAWSAQVFLHKQAKSVFPGSFESLELGRLPEIQRRAVKIQQTSLLPIPRQW